jgi:chromosome segregation ATPase
MAKAVRLFWNLFFCSALVFFIGQARAENADVSGGLAYVYGQIEVLTAQNERLKQDNRNLFADIDMARIGLESVKKLKAEAALRCEQRIREAKFQVRELGARNASLLKEKDAAVARCAEAAVAQYNQQTDEKFAALEKKADEALAEKGKELAELRDKETAALRQVKELSSQIDALKKEQEKLAAASRGADAEQSRLKKQLEDARVENVKRIDEISRQKGQELAALQEKEAAVSRQVQELTAQVASLTGEQARIARMNDQCQAKAEAVSRASDEALAGKAKEIDAIREKEAAASRQVLELTAQVNALKSDQALLARSNERCEEKSIQALKAAEESMASLKKKLEDACGQKLQAADQALQQKSREYDQLQLKEALAGRKADLLDSQNRNLTKENARLTLLNEELARKNSQVVQKAQEIVSAKAEQCVKGVYQVDDPPRIVRMLEKKIALVRKDNDRLMQLNNQLMEKNALVINKAQDIVGAKAEQCMKGVYLSEAPPRLVRMLEKKISALRERNDLMDSKNVELETVGKEAMLERDDLKTKVRFLEERSKTMESKIGELARENEDLRMAKSKVENKSKEHYIELIDLREKGRTYEDLSGMVLKLNAEVVELRNSRENLREELSGLRKGLEKERSMLYREAGTAYTRNGLFEEAITAYSEAVKLDPSDPSVHYYLGILYSRHGNNTDAVRSFKKYLEMAPQAENREEVEYIMAMLNGKKERRLNRGGTQ